MTAPGSVLLASGSLGGGGAERVIVDMANYWCRSGVSVTCATWSGPEIGDCYALDAGVHRAWLNEPGSWRTTLGRLRHIVGRVLRLRRLIRERKPDAILSFISASNVLTILAATGTRTRVVVSERIDPASDTDLSAFKGAMRRLTYWRADRVVAQTEAAADWIRSHCRARVSVVPNALRELPPPGLVREPRILGVGRLVRQKGFDLLIRAFADIAGRFPGWRVAIAGEGGLRRDLEDLAARLGLGDRVEFLGRVVAIESLMATAGLVVQPSRFEGFPNALLESMGMGAPVIATACRSGPSEMITDGVNGRLVPVEDVAALSAAMAELMASATARESLGREAQKVRQRFALPRIMAMWESCLEVPGQ